MLSLDHIDVHYRHTGKGDITLIFIHGNSMSLKSFDRQLDSVLSEQYNLVAIDLPGHGKTRVDGKPDQFYTVPGLVSFLCNVIHELNLNNYILLGHSLGGHIAIEAADKLNGLLGIMAWGTPPLTYEKTASAPFREHLAIPLLFSEELVTNNIRTLSKAYWSDDQEPPSGIAKNISHTDPVFRSILSKSIETGEWEDEVKIVESLSSPIALGIGEFDALINCDYIRETVAGKLWRKTLHTIPGAGHSAHMENPSDFNKWAESFIKSIQ